MDCSAAEGMVNRYINRTLSPDELERFLNHVENCPACREELETYFIVHKVTQQLDEEKSAVSDFQKLLAEDIRASRHHIFREKVRHLVRGFGLCLLIGLLVVFLVFIAMEIRQLVV